jgi:deoxyribodipyrimidine photo-lyase
MWFRRDLRLQDHPALAAAADAGRVVALLALDDARVGRRELHGWPVSGLHAVLLDVVGGLWPGPRPLRMLES